jgi:hypothetical protein
MIKRYLVDLTRRERTELLGLLNKSIAPARTLTRARILLAADEHKTDAEIAASLHVHPATVERTRRRFRAAALPSPEGMSGMRHAPQGQSS